MIQYFIKYNGQLKELEEPEVSCWINITPPFSQAELKEVSDKYDVPLDFLTDSLDVDERSRYEREDDLRLIVLNTPILNNKVREDESIYVTVPIGIILTLEHIITISAFENPVLDLFLENRIKNFDPADEQLFVLQIFEQNVYRFLSCLKSLNLKRNQIEKELADSLESSQLRQLLSIEKSLVYFVNTLSANDLLKLKMKRTDFLHIRPYEDKMDLFEDIIIDNSQALEMSNVYTNILSSTMDAYTSIISNNLNVVIQRLTLITIILMVPTLVASFYGMNVNVPFDEDKGSTLAFFSIIGFSILISLALAWFFRRKKLI
ncbi:MAG: magnesium transporter CorA family protein [Bacteroidota bacterium]